MTIIHDLDSIHSPPTAVHDSLILIVLMRVWMEHVKCPDLSAVNGYSAGRRLCLILVCIGQTAANNHHHHHVGWPNKYRCSRCASINGIIWHPRQKDGPESRATPPYRVHRIYVLYCRWWLWFRAIGFSYWKILSVPYLSLIHIPVHFETGTLSGLRLGIYPGVAVLCFNCEYVNVHYIPVIDEYKYCRLADEKDIFSVFRWPTVGSGAYLYLARELAARLIGRWFINACRRYDVAAGPL